MRDGRTHLAHKAEHAVDLETGAIVGVTVQGADQGDTTTTADTVTAAAEDLEAVAAATDDHTVVIEEVVADKGYHSNQVLVDLAALDLRTIDSNSYLSPSNTAFNHGLLGRIDHFGALRFESKRQFQQRGESRRDCRTRTRLDE
jgi:hypothetical protein